jgi:hypothetical protein
MRVPRNMLLLLNFAAALEGCKFFFNSVFVFEAVWL